MREFTIDLEPQYDRPTIRIAGQIALIDTGALIPVISLSERVLNEIFNAKAVTERSAIYGFGGECKGRIYTIDKMMVGQLIYPNMHVFVPDESIDGYDIILSATMFNGLMYDINTIDNKITVHVPNESDLVRNLVLRDDNGKIHVLLNGQEIREQYNNYQYTNSGNICKRIDNYEPEL